MKTEDYDILEVVLLFMSTYYNFLVRNYDFTNVNLTLQELGNSVTNLSLNISVQDSVAVGYMKNTFQSDIIFFSSKPC